MANSNSPDETSVESLSTIFNEGLHLYNQICNSEEPINYPAIQSLVKTAMKHLEQATRLVSYSGVFSRNEGIEEVSTNDLQYFLLPVLLGSLSLKLTSGERKDVIDAAEVYFKDYLSRCHDYNLTDFEIKEKVDEQRREPRNEFEQIAASINTRSNKIQRYKQQKELKQKLADLKKNVENEHADEDIKRDYFLTMLKSFIYESVDELNSIEMEKPILEHHIKVSKSGEKLKRIATPPPLRPVIITKDEVQKAVYGAGYPSLPTMTVQEFYDQRVRDGVFPNPNAPKKGPLSLQQASLAGIELNDEDREAEMKEKAEEEDDSANLERLRRMDEFKDEHRRGWGNRMNRS